MIGQTLRDAVAADDVEATAIAIALDDHPNLRPEHVRAALDALAWRLAPRVLGIRGHARLGRLLTAVYRDEGFRTPTAYDDPRLHHLNCVVARRVGSPVALAAMLIAIARRLGVPLSGVAFPGHFMVRYEASEPVFVDPASGAFPFPAESLRALAADELAVPLEDTERFLQPVGARTFAVRLLQNLQRAHECRGDLGRALVVADRLYDVTGAASARCERGLKAAALGAPHGALDDLFAYLRDHRDAEVERAAAELAATPHQLN